MDYTPHTDEDIRAMLATIGAESIEELFSPIPPSVRLQRDLALLHKNLADTPEEPFCLFNLGSILQEQGQPAEALPVFRRSLAQSQPGDSIVRKLYALIASCHKRLGPVAGGAGGLP